MNTELVAARAALRRVSRDGMSNRALQCKYGVTWSTVNKALTLAWPRPRTTTASVRPSKLDPFTLVIDEILLIDLDATRNSATPSPRIHRRLIDEHSSSEALRCVALTT
ncbi:hypothetical protein ACIRPU_40285 [Streptomyces sp. NPDC102259]|uniref:hypothetical protein n=1 Tax=Streptomyces sp. NPDC102259 TaxID=3366148 RepID=UPI00380A7ED9